MRTTTIGSFVLAGTLVLAGCSSDGDVNVDAGVEADADGDGAAAEGAAGASISFGGLEDGATVSSPVSVSFDTEGFQIIPAAEGGGDGSGHMHVMIDVGCVPVGETIPSDESHVHFGDGSTSAELELEPGEHELCLQAGDGDHTALEVTDEISITVE